VDKENLEYICSQLVASPSQSLRLFSVECQAMQSTFTTLLNGSLQLPDCLARHTYYTCLQKFVLRFVLKKRGYNPVDTKMYNGLAKILAFFMQSFTLLKNRNRVGG